LRSGRDVLRVLLGWHPTGHPSAASTYAAHREAVEVEVEVGGHGSSGRGTLTCGHHPDVGTVGVMTRPAAWRAANLWRAAAGVLLLLAVLRVVVLLVRSGGSHHVRRTVAEAGAWAPVLFVLLQGVVTITPLPRTVFTVAAGVLFGAWAGVLLTILATLLAALAAYWLVGSVGGGFVERHSHRPGVAWVRGRLDHNGLLAVLSLRLIPAVPFSVMNYAAGLAKVRVLPYAVGTALGVLPGTVAIVVLGDAATGGSINPASFAVSVVGGLLGLAGAAVASRRGPAARPELEPAAAAPGSGPGTAS
jgi:uncharacterized membrane protein YdjX (TVP38/TMEM64 family)